MRSLKNADSALPFAIVETTGDILTTSKLEVAATYKIEATVWDLKAPSKKYSVSFTIVVEAGNSLEAEPCRLTVNNLKLAATVPQNGNSI